MRNLGSGEGHKPREKISKECELLAKYDFVRGILILFKIRDCNFDTIIQLQNDFSSVTTHCSNFPLELNLTFSFLRSIF